MAEVDNRAMSSRGGEGSNSLGSANQNGEQTNAQGGESYNIDGRTTPTPESESAHHLSRTSSIRSAAGLASSASAIPNLASTESTNGSQQPQFIKAEVGFGPLSGEDQLKSSLKGKDRIFLLVLAKEIEAFIEKVALGQECHIIPSIPLATNSTSVLASMSASFAVASHISSTFQRMLVYKLAEWYGLKAVNTPEVSMLVGVIGTMNPQSRGLKLSDLAPRADTPPQKFRIMQRAQPNSSNSSDANGISRASSIGLEDAGSETSSSKVRTLEEREAAYNKARQRIYGATNGSDGALDTTTAPTATIRGPRPVQDVSDDYETAPRQPTVVSEPTFQPVFPSLYDPPKTTTNGVAGPSSQSYDPPTSYQHDNMRQHYPPQSQVQMQIPSYMPNYQQQSGYQPEYAHGPQQQYGMPPYMAQGNPYGMPQHANNGYPNQWGQSQQHPHQQQQHHHHHQQQQPAYGRQHQQMPPNQAMPHGWMQPNHGQGSSQGQGPMPMPNQPMPMIPQGMQYPGAYGHPPQQQVYPPLMQPTPTRPAVHPHSSASSSISSRSYQSYHDGSRPHSRGSTTSNMSATSSVRFGAMYPANQGGGYRQKGIKGQGMNGMNALPGFGTSSEKRSTRAHSPSSTTTTSSRSSRQAGSISLVPPSQYPLPQRPDWAANNVPYQIAPINRNGPADQNGSPSTNDFPPLARNGNGNTGTHAEPMQVERAKSRPSGSSAWNGVGPKPLGQIGGASPSSPAHEMSPTSPRAKMLRTPGPLVPSPKTPIGVSALSPTSAERDSHSQTHDENDFPRRATSMNSSQTLFDPSASVSTPVSATLASASSASRPGSTIPIPVQAPAPIEDSSMSPEEIIEAKLAAISLREGVVIGPPPTKENGNGTSNGPAPSYARIVKRD